LSEAIFFTEMSACVWSGENLRIMLSHFYFYDTISYTVLSEHVILWRIGFDDKLVWLDFLECWNTYLDFTCLHRK